MTTQQLHVANGLYLLLLVVFLFFTRPTARRLAGALAGGAIFGVVALASVALGEKVGWWWMAISWEPYFLALLFLDSLLSCAPIYVVTWRVARRFGWRGLALVVVALAVLGPPRDYQFMATHPEWGAYMPGVAPLVTVGVTYALGILLGHWVMWLVAGPARVSPLARRPWEAFEPSADPARHVPFWDFKAPRSGPRS
jgi:hypothetical protein